jgi:tRNA threonylcarbamoyladenosine biosynthesis protein TsaB
MQSEGRILSIETAVNVCSVCVSDENGIISIIEEKGVNNHSSQLAVFIDRLMKETATSYSSLAAVAVSGGPGSYTGLRIGVSTAKGICYAADIPLIAVDSLHAMAWMMKKIYVSHTNDQIFFRPMIDARRMEVYTALYDKNLVEIESVSAEIINENFFANSNNSNIVVLGGNGVGKLTEMASSFQTFDIINENVHSAEGVAHIAHKKLLNADFANTAYYVPFYLKDFIPGKPKVKGLL